MQIPFFGSSPKPPGHFITLHSDWNFNGVPTSSLEFSILGSTYSYHHGRPEYSGGSDHNQNSGSSSDPNIVLANNKRQALTNQRQDLME
jgi:K+-transporting ATPase c subunit